MFIDRIIAEATSRDKIRFLYADRREGHRAMLDVLDRLQSAQCFDFQVMPTIYANHVDSRGSFVFARDAFCVKPPFPNTWCETVAGDSKVGCLVTQSSGRGAYANTETIITDARRRGLTNDLGFVEIETSGETVYFSDATTVFLTLALDWPEGIFIMPNILSCDCDLQGAPITMPTINPTAIKGLPQTTIDIILRVIGHSYLFWFGFSLLACKNVMIEIQEPSHRLQKSRQRRGKHPLKPFYVLNVSIDRSMSAEREGRNDEQKTVKRLHLVRGHIADYSQGGGLFGKLHGRYWVPAHARGSQEAGEIQKSYKILAPKNNTGKE